MLRILVTALTSGPLLEAQAAAIKRWIPGPYELTVINDARADEHFSNLWQTTAVDEINQSARRVGATCVRFPQWRHLRRETIFPDEPEEFAELETANTRCADAIQWGVNILLAKSDDPLLILDADMIPYAPFDWRALLKEHPIWGYPQGRQDNGGPLVLYLWNGLLLVNPAACERMDLFNLDCGNIDGTGVDVGGLLYKFLEANPERTGTFFRRFGEQWIAPGEDGDMPVKVMEFLNWDNRFSAMYGRAAETYGDCFLHLAAGGNWELRGRAHMSERIKRFVEAVA
jgi:hypothetical protein